MRDYLAVTSFSPAGYELYGQRFLKSFLRYTDLEIVPFIEGNDLDDSLIRPRVHQALLKWSPGWSKFQENAPPVMQPCSYWERWDQNGRRFSHKVFAVTSSFAATEHRWRIWIDADVEFHSPLYETTLRDLCPEDCCVSFLGRKNYAWSECGFVAYKVSDPRVLALLADIRNVYTSGELFRLPRDRWHDSAVFDLCRQRSGIPEHEQHNISAGASGREVWEQTLLHKVAFHRKGPRRKKEAYGGTCE